MIKVYESGREGGARYSPAVCVGSHPQTMIGDPDPLWVSTSYVERQNLTMRMSMRRFTPLPLVQLARIHQTIRTTPAMAAGVADHRWTAEEIAVLLDDPKYADLFRDARVGAKVA